MVTATIQHFTQKCSANQIINDFSADRKNRRQGDDDHNSHRSGTIETVRLRWKQPLNFFLNFGNQCQHFSLATRSTLYICSKKKTL